MTNQAMGVTPTFESDEAKDAYIDTVIAETGQLEVKAEFAKKFVEMYESPTFKTVILEGLLGTHMAEVSARLVDPYTTEELEDEILIELRALRYLNKYLDNTKTRSVEADRLVRDNKQLLLDLQSVDYEDM